MDTSDNSVGSGGSGITLDDTTGTGNRSYVGIVSGASVAPAAAVGHFTPG